MLVTLNVQAGVRRYDQACPGCTGLERLAQRRIDDHEEAAREQRAIAKDCRLDAERQRLLGRGSVRSHVCGRPGYSCTRQQHIEREAFLLSEARESRAMALAHERLAAAARDELDLARARQRDGTCLLCWCPRPHSAASVGAQGRQGGARG